MIVRDEARFLADCLARAASWVDEMVVVDTGSSDGSIAIATAHGARVIERPWTDNFAAARNHGLVLATGDWVLVLDADEFVDPDAAERVRAAIASPRHAGYALRMRSHVADGRGPTRDVAMLRLFRRLPGVAFEGRIHEQVWPSLLTAASAHGLLIADLDVAVEHHGYTAEVYHARAKDTRNERLFRLQLADRPDDPYHLYKFGDFLSRHADRVAEARALFARALAQLDNRSPAAREAIPYAAELAAATARLDLDADDLDTAEAVVTRAVRDFRPTPYLHFVAATIAVRRGRLSAALAHLEACRAFDGELLPVPVQPGLTSWRAWLATTDIHLRRGDLARAAAALERAIAAAGHAAADPAAAAEPLALASARLELRHGRVGNAVGVLTDLLRRQPDAPAATAAIAEILEQVGEPERAARLRAEAVERATT